MFGDSNLVGFRGGGGGGRGALELLGEVTCMNTLSRASHGASSWATL